MLRRSSKGADRGQLQPKALADDRSLLLRRPWSTAFSPTHSLHPRPASARMTNRTSLLKLVDQIRRQRVHAHLKSSNARPAPYVAAVILTLEHPIPDDLRCHPADFGRLGAGATIVGRRQSRQAASLRAIFALCEAERSCWVSKSARSASTMTNPPCSHGSEPDRSRVEEFALESATIGSGICAGISERLPADAVPIRISRWKAMFRRCLPGISTSP